jgi:hypothetical protein
MLVKAMKFTVIEGGLSLIEATRALVEGKAGPTPAEVRAEGARRIKALGSEEVRTREFATGRTMPTQSRYLEMQIEFVVEAMCRMDRIPADFRDNRYWPPIG